MGLFEFLLQETSVEFIEVVKFCYNNCQYIGTSKVWNTRTAFTTVVKTAITPVYTSRNDGDFVDVNYIA